MRCALVVDGHQDREHERAEGGWGRLGGRAGRMGTARDVVSLAREQPRCRRGCPPWTRRRTGAGLRGPEAGRGSSCCGGSPTTGSGWRSLRRRWPRTVRAVSVDRMLGGRHTAEENGRDGDRRTALRIHRLTGCPRPAPTRSCSAEGVVDVALDEAVLDGGVGEEAISQITRVLGESMARFGDDHRDVRRRVPAARRHRGGRREPVRRAGGELRPLSAGADRRVQGPPAQASPRDDRPVELAAGQIQGEQHLAVCFADSSGSPGSGGRSRSRSWDRGRGSASSRRAAVGPCAWSRRSATQRCSSAASRPLVEVALSLVEAVEGGLPALRAGVAVGRRCSARATSSGTRSTWPAGSPGSPGPAACSAPRRSARRRRNSSGPRRPAPAQGGGRSRCTAPAPAGRGDEGRDAARTRKAGRRRRRASR